MFESLKSLWKKETRPPEEYDEQSRVLAEEIARLESELQGNPGNGEIQKALSVYAKSQTHRQEIDSLFVRIDELRNVIRRNI